MSQYKYQLFLISIGVVALSILMISALMLRDLPGIATTVGGVVVGGAGVALYDTWTKPKPRRQR